MGKWRFKKSKDLVICSLWYVPVPGHTMENAVCLFAIIISIIIVIVIIIVIIIIETLQILYLVQSTFLTVQLHYLLIKCLYTMI